MRDKISLIVFIVRKSNTHGCLFVSKADFEVFLIETKLWLNLNN